VKGIVTISPENGAWYAAAGAAGATLIGTAIIWPLMKRSLSTFDNQNANSIEAGKDATAGSSAFLEEDRFQRAVAEKLKPVHVDDNDKSVGATFKRFRNAALSGVTHDIHADVKDDEAIMDMHDAAEKFDPRTEHVFKVLQVISACAMSFAHGETNAAVVWKESLFLFVELLDVSFYYHPAAGSMWFHKHPTCWNTGHFADSSSAAACLLNLLSCRCQRRCQRHRLLLRQPLRVQQPGGTRQQQ
jgi:hypothetical protein